MSFISGFAIYFVLWWLLLFAVLPFGLRTQDEANDVTLGTTRSAPSRPHFLKAAAINTVVTGIVFGAYYWLTVIAGYGFADLPMIAPDFRNGPAS